MTPTVLSILSSLSEIAKFDEFNTIRKKLELISLRMFGFHLKKIQQEVYKIEKVVNLLQREILNNDCFLKPSEPYWGALMLALLEFRVVVYKLKKDLIILNADVELYSCYENTLFIKEFITNEADCDVASLDSLLPRETDSLLWRIRSTLEISSNHNYSLGTCTDKLIKALNQFRSSLNQSDIRLVTDKFGNLTIQSN